MLLTRILRWLFGWVRLRAEGGFPERLLNLAARDNVQLWEVGYPGEYLEACCPARQYRRLRAPARRAGMRMKIKTKRGLPFLARRYRRRTGLLPGMCGFILILHLLSRYTWVVEVAGNEQVPSEDILSVMETLGVREGGDLSGLDIPTIQLQALEKLPGLAWCAVNFSGSVATVEVKERVPAPELSHADIPSTIVAARDGRIVSVEVYTGQSLVQAGDAVFKGMPLVSGTVESAAGPLARRAQAKILAETDRVLEVRVPMKETLTLPTGEIVLQPSLRFFFWEFPLYPSMAVSSPNELTVLRSPLTVFGRTLPVGLISRSYTLTAPVERAYTGEEAASIARLRLDEAKDATMAEAEVTRAEESGRADGEWYVLTGSYRCIENIALEQPAEPSA